MTMLFLYFVWFISDNTSRASNIPLVTPASLLLLARGRVALVQNHGTVGFGIPIHFAGYLAPEYKPNKYRTDIETEKVNLFLLTKPLIKKKLDCY